MAPETALLLGDSVVVSLLGSCSMTPKNGSVYLYGRITMHRLRHNTTKLFENDHTQIPSQTPASEPEPVPLESSNKHARERVELFVTKRSTEELLMITVSMDHKRWIDRHGLALFRAWQSTDFMVDEAVGKQHNCWRLWVKRAQLHMGSVPAGRDGAVAQGFLHCCWIC